MFKRWTLVLILILIAALPVFAQDGTYTLNIEGVITNENGSPSVFKSVVLLTNTGEGIEVQTDLTGHFRMVGTIRGEQGTLTVKSSHADNVIFGEMPLTWAAGGFGEKTLAANLIIHENGTMTLQGGGTEIITPGENGDAPLTLIPELPTVTPLPTAMPNIASTPEAQSTPLPQPNDNGDGSLVWLIVGGLFGLALIGGGAWFLLAQKKVDNG